MILEYDPEAESFSAVCPELPGCASARETEDEARRGIEEAIRLYLSPAEIEMSPIESGLSGISTRAGSRSQRDSGNQCG